MQLLVIACVVIWASALVSLCSRRDIDIHSKLSWVVTVLALHAVGAVLYFVFGPKCAVVVEPGHEIDPDAVPITPEGMSWNPILGENRMSAGEGLNPKEEKNTEPEN